MDHWSGFDVCTCFDFSAPSARLHGGIDFDWFGAMHCHGSGVERFGGGQQGIWRGLGGVEFTVPSICLQLLCLVVHFGFAAVFRIQGRYRSDHHVADRTECIYLSRHSFFGRSDVSGCGGEIER